MEPVPEERVLCRMRDAWSATVRCEENLLTDDCRTVQSPVWSCQLLYRRSRCMADLGFKERGPGGIESRCEASVWGLESSFITKWMTISAQKVVPNALRTSGQRGDGRNWLPPPSSHWIRLWQLCARYVVTRANGFSLLGICFVYSFVLWWDFDPISFLAPT